MQLNRPRTPKQKEKGLCHPNGTVPNIRIHSSGGAISLTAARAFNERGKPLNGSVT